MKKILFVFILFVILVTLKTTPAVAAVSCGGTCKISADCVTECPVCINPRGIGMICSKSSAGGGGDTNQPLDLDTIQQKAFGIALPKDLGSFISSSKILEYVFGAAGIALLIYLVLGGFQMMTSRGDPKAMQGAQAKITNALIGFVIVIFAYFVVSLLGSVFHIGPFIQIFGGGRSIR